jgi:hypothetical protein
MCGGGYLGGSAWATPPPRERKRRSAMNLAGKPGLPFVNANAKRPDMSASDRPQIVHDGFSAYASRDRSIIVERNLTDDFVFSAPAFVNEQRGE